MDDVQRIVVELLKHEDVVRLEAQNADLLSQLNSLRAEYRVLEQRYIRETYINMELCDLLRRHGISYRDLLDHRKRLERFGENL